MGHDRTRAMQGMLRPDSPRTPVLVWLGVVLIKRPVGLSPRLVHPVHCPVCCAPRDLVYPGHAGDHNQKQPAGPRAGRHATFFRLPVPRLVRNSDPQERFLLVEENTQARHADLRTNPAGPSKLTLRACSDGYYPVVRWTADWPASTYDMCRRNMRSLS